MYLGDTNEDLLNPNVHSLKDILILNSLKNVISQPKRQHTLLDPIITHNDMSFLHQGILEIPPGISDHSATYLYLRFNTLRIDPSLVKFGYIKMQLLIAQQQNTPIDWTCLNQDSVNDASTLFNNIIY